jgi:hypothetical protein
MYQCQWASLCVFLLNKPRHVFGYRAADEVTALRYRKLTDGVFSFKVKRNEDGDSVIVSFTGGTRFTKEYVNREAMREVKQELAPLLSMVRSMYKIMDEKTLLSCRASRFNMLALDAEKVSAVAASQDLEQMWPIVEAGIGWCVITERTSKAGIVKVTNRSLSYGISRFIKQIYPHQVLEERELPEGVRPY